MLSSNAFTEHNTPLNHREVLSIELNHLVNQMRVRLTLIGTPKQVTEEILFTLTSHADKQSFLDECKDLLNRSTISTTKVISIENELDWLLRKDNFRWSFKAFNLHDLKIISISEDIIHYS